MTKSNIAILLAITIFFASCQKDEKLVATTTIDSTFEPVSGITPSTEGWAAGFTEYPVKTDTAKLAMRFYLIKMPAPLDTTTSGLTLQSTNVDGDMFMYIKKKVQGFLPGKTYSASFDIDFVTNYRSGADSLPGNSIFIKAGATTKEPADTINADNHVFTLDKGSLSQGGKDLVLLGNVTNGLDKNSYQSVKRGNTENPQTNVVANDKGEIWLCIGIDSGVKARSIYFFDRIVVKIWERIDE